MSDETRTFSVSLWCSNCGTKWDELVPFQTEVSSGGGVFFHPKNCSGRTGLDCKGWRAECAVCGLIDKVQRRYG